MLIEKNITPFFEIISLSAKEYLDCLKNTSERRISGGAVYDALILMAATKTDPDRIYTFNVKQFKDLYSSSSGLIHAP
jgi:predicted nucleic acid-binding protein